MTVQRLVNFMSHQYHQTDRITTLVDFYGFKDRDGRSRAKLEDDIRNEVARVTRGYDERFVLPYVQMHEFEGLLFSDPEAFEWVVDGWDDQTRRAVHKVASAFDNPEQINDSPETAPSKRILRIFQEGSYSKVEHGALIAEHIGIDKIRAKCPEFDKWVGNLQSWGGKG